jgi:hypothetical protein
MERLTPEKKIRQINENLKVAEEASSEVAKEYAKDRISCSDFL